MTDPSFAERENEITDGPVEMHGPRALQQVHPLRVSGRSRRRLVVGLLITLGLAGTAAGAGILGGFLPNPVVAGDPRATGLNESKEASIPRVKAIHPRRDPSFRLSTHQIATVEPYIQAGLRARVSGVVRSVAKDIGEPVRAGELLVVIDVPDLEQAVEQKSALIVQRQRELAAAGTDLKVARVAVQVAAAASLQKVVEVARAKDLLSARKFDLDAVKVLFQQDSAVRSRVESAILDYHAAERAVESAEADVAKSKAEEAGKAASVDKAEADIELKRALVDVARKDRDVAAAQLGYSRLYAPFDGMITARTADPGQFVPNATTGASEPLITIARTDIVTVVMKAPDTAAPFISSDTEVAIEFAQRPEVVVHGKVTRFSPAIDQGDRTMRVEVDVCNVSDEYRANQVREAAHATMSLLQPLDRAAGLAMSGPALIGSKLSHKGWHEGEALMPDWGSGHRPVVAGTTATMRVFLDKFVDSPLLPASAVYGKSGQPYIMLVERGVTRAVPVVVQLSDGRLAKVAMVDSVGSRESTHELTGNEIIVLSRQAEVGEGTRVDAVVEGW